MVIGQRQVKTPFFLDSTQYDMLVYETHALAQDFGAQHGDTIHARVVGTDKDPRDGWPLKVFILTLERN